MAMLRNFSFVIFAITAGVMPFFAFSAANSQSFHVQGQLFDERGASAVPVTEPGVDFAIGIYSPNGKCLIYEEAHSNVDLSASNGVFSFPVGAGARTASDRGNSMAQIFSNKAGASIAAKPDVGCQAGSYFPAAGDGRMIRFTVAWSGGTTTLPDQLISSVPQATVAESLQGLDPKDFMQVTGNASAYVVSKSALDVLLGTSGPQDASSLHHHDGSYAKLSGSSSISLQNSSYLGLGVHASVPDTTGWAGDPSKIGRTWYDSSSGEIKFWSGSAVKSLGVSGAGVSSFNTRTGAVTLSSADVTGALGFTPSQVPNGNGLNAGFPLSAQNGAAPIYQALDLGSSAASGTLAASRFPALTGAVTTAAGSLATTLTDDSVTDAKVANGISASKISGNITGNAANVTGVVAIANGGTGQTTAANAINALMPNQSGQNGKFLTTNGTTVDWASVTMADASKLPLTGGTMTGMLRLASGSTTSAPLKYTSGSLLAVPSQGDVEFDGSNLYITLTSATTDRHRVCTYKNDFAPGDTALGHVLTWTSDGWEPQAIPGTTWLLQTANTVFAAPNGAAGTPAFRSLAADDIPFLDASKLNSGTLSVARGGTGTATLTGILKGNGTSAFTAAVAKTDYAPPTTGTAILKGDGSGGFVSAVSGTDYGTITALTGDVTASGTGSVSAAVVKVNGTSVPGNSSANQALITSAAGAGAWVSIPNCTNTGNNHLNYDSTMHQFTCGTSSALSFGTISGTEATALGHGTTASGTYSTAMGNGSIASALDTTALGSAAIASADYSTAIGRSADAQGNYTTAIGYGTIAQSFSETAVGSFNKSTGGSPTSWVPSEPIFVVGNGASTASRSTAMTVLKNGNVGIGETAPAFPLVVKGTVSFAGATSGRITLRAPASGGTADYVLPPAVGASGQVLATDNTGNLYWTYAPGVTCPPGTSLVGTLGQGGFCVSSTPETAASWISAVGTCGLKSPAMRLCSIDEWVLACTKLSWTFSGSSNQEWVAAHYGDNTSFTAGYNLSGVGCDRATTSARTIAYSFRCCMKP